MYKRLLGRKEILHEQRIIIFSMEKKMKIIYLFIGNEILALGKRGACIGQGH